MCSVLTRAAWRPVWGLLGCLQKLLNFDHLPGLRPFYGSGARVAAAVRASDVSHGSVLCAGERTGEPSAPPPGLAPLLHALSSKKASAGATAEATAAGIVQVCAHWLIPSRTFYTGTEEHNQRACDAVAAIERVCSLPCCA